LTLTVQRRLTQEHGKVHTILSRLAMEIPRLRRKSKAAIGGTVCGEALRGPIVRISRAEVQRARKSPAVDRAIEQCKGSVSIELIAWVGQ
jgi:hypothetical protein